MIIVINKNRLNKPKNVFSQTPSSIISCLQEVIKKPSETRTSTVTKSDTKEILKD